VKKKRRGALHKLGKMLRGGSGKQAVGEQQAQQQQAQQQQRGKQRGNPAAPLGHSMLEQEASALQGQVLRERQQKGEMHHAAAAMRQQHGAEPAPAEVPDATWQQMKQQHAQQQEQWERRQQQHTAAEEGGQFGWAAYDDGPFARQHQAAPSPPQYEPAAPVERGPLHELRGNAPQQQRQRPGSALSDCPPEGGARYYSYPDAAAASYAAGLAEMQAEMEAAGAGLGTPGAGVLAGMAEQVSWQQRSLHVMHSNALFDGGAAAAAHGGGGSAP
jgi:hypothetical protein